MIWSFRTNGNYIDFVHTEETSLQDEEVVFHLHNSSRCIDWSLPSDTTRISFTIDETKYDNVRIQDIDFDGTSMNEQADFETNITAMFTGGSSYLVATGELTDEQIKSFASTDSSTQITLLDDLAAGKIPVILNAVVQIDTLAGAYSNVDLADSYFAIAYQKNGSIIHDLCYVKINGSMNVFSSATSSLIFSLPQAVYNSSYSTIEGSPRFAPQSDFSGCGLCVYCYNSLGAFQDGNEANSLKITVYYTTLDL